MIYLALIDFESYISTTHLNEITSSNPLLLNDVELSCIEEMKGYLNVRYDAVKCFDVPKIEIIKAKLLDLVIYEIHARISPKNVPELRVNRKKDAIQWLEKTASGYIAPLLPIKAIEATQTPLRYGNSKPKTEQYY